MIESLRHRINIETYYSFFIYVLLLAVLLILFTITIFFWDIPQLGLAVHPLTHEVTDVERGGSANNAGIQTGDKVIAAYDTYLWEDILQLPNILALTPPITESIPFIIQRNDTYMTLYLTQQHTVSFQIQKAIRFYLGFLCWLTGYTVMVVRKHHVQKSRSIALFWICLGLVLGTQLFLSYAAPRLEMFLYWILVLILAPACFFLFVKFPPRTTDHIINNYLQTWIYFFWIFLNGILIVLISIFHYSTFQITFILSSINGYVWLCIFIVTGIFLWMSYFKENVEHYRRQIRIIAFSFIITGTTWALLASLSSIFNYKWMLFDYIVPIIPGIIPLSFLTVYVVTDLYQVDRFFRRITGILITVTILTMSNQWITSYISLERVPIAVFSALYVVVFYRPLFQLINWLFPFIRLEYHELKVIEKSIHKLTTSLDLTYLLHVIQRSIDQAFGNPAFVYYGTHPSQSQGLHLITKQRIENIPSVINEGVLQAYFCQKAQTIIEGGQLFQVINGTPSEEEGILINHHRVILWCPIHNAEKQLLGIILLGMRSDLEPYRQRDIQLLERLIDAASLALSNSATFMVQKESEELIRQLFQALKQSQDETAAAIARELHDEVININLRLNIQSLEQIVSVIADPILREELELILDTEHDIARALRKICERLQPTAINDPYGLPSILRMQIERIQPLWSGSCSLITSNDPVSVPSTIQKEILRITREALTNVIKHANASKIDIYLVYPKNPVDMIQLSITDNGTNTKSITPKKGHFGIHYMRESVNAIQGNITFSTLEDGGTCVTVLAPLYNHQQVEFQERFAIQ